MKLLHNFLGLLASFCLILVLLISSVELVIYGFPNYFEKEYTKYKVAEQISISMPDLLQVTDEMMDYLKGKRVDLHITTTINGEQREFFNEREIAHMEDVQALFLKGMALRNICLVIIILGIGTLFFLKADVKRILPKMIQYGTGLFFLAVILLGFLISLNFTRAFTIFHELLFTNDLWYLDPATDLLINIVPEPFFIDTALYIGIAFLISITFLFVGSACCIRKNKL